MDKYFVDVKEFTKPRYTRSNYIPDELHTDVLRKGHAMPQLNRRSSELRKHSGSKKIVKDSREDYETDCRRKGQPQVDFELEELRRLVSQCQHCRSRLPEFVTKKPKYHELRSIDASTQASIDTTLLQLLQEKMDEIRRYSKQQSKQLSKLKEMVEMKEDELDDMEERFTAVVYKVSQDIFLFERVLTECHHLKVLASLNSDAPSFLKCMAMDESIQAAGHG